ncbi:NADH-dependent alcohol dehydrogenase [Clostridia bacterium]|nr:NADH-dependent alcohol dehydrogenase [Clostridia bacterium]
MTNFEFYAPARIVFGKDTHKQIGGLLAPHAKKILLHFGGGSIKKSGVYDDVTASLKAAGISYAELGGVVPNPRLSLVHEGVKLCREEKVELILAVGGGSVIDSAKAIAMGVYYDGDVWDFYDKGLAVERALPVATVLTIPAAGSESSGDTVITNEALELKFGYGSSKLRPLISVMNPELFYSLPKYQTASGVADIMSHIFERYFTNTTHTDLTDGLCETTLRTIIKNAPIVLRDPENYDAWSEIGFGGTVAHNGLLGCGRDQDWGCHNMEHELSAIYDVTHGAGLAVLTPAWMRYVYKDNVNMFVQFAVNVMGVDGSYRDPDAIVNEGIDRLRAFFNSLGLPSTLSGLGIGEDKLELMARKCAGDGTVGGLKKLGWQDVLNIYQSVK